MKESHAKMSTKIFNFRLFLEGLKRLRVIGLATAILALTASALVPIVMWIENNPNKRVDVDTELLCVPVGLVTFLAPFFFFVLFSFLQKRKESDFFHSIPYTRTCVYNSFVTAALTFVWVIQIACGLTAGILWSMIPWVTFDLGGLIAYVLICMLATAMLCSFMMLALTVSGTAGSCMLLFVLFAGFVRVVLAIWGGCMSSIDLLPMHDIWRDAFLSPLCFLPINILYYFMDIETASAIMYSLPNILYTVIVTLAVYALAGLIYKHRRSEMAGNPAPGTRSQALFRIMFTLLPTLLIPLFLIIGEDDAALHLVLVVVILLVYFLYELITTKRPKNMLKAIPGLGFVAAGCILFILVFQGYRTTVLNEEIDDGDIKTVSVESAGLGYSTYQGYLLDHLQTDDPEIVKMIADQLAESQNRERVGKYGEKYGDLYWNRSMVTIRLKNGRTLRRNIILTEEHLNQIVANLRELDEVQEILYQLPNLDEIESGGFYLNISTLSGGYDYGEYGHYDVSYMTELMETFRAEFNDLTDSQKDRVMAQTFRNSDLSELDTCLTLTLRGRIHGEYFISEYNIIEEMPRTRAQLLTLWSRDDYNYYDCSDSEWSGDSAEVLAQFLNDLNDKDFMDIHEYVSVELFASPVGGGEKVVSNFDKAYVYENEYIRVKTEQLPELVTLLLERDLLRKDEKVKDRETVAITEDTYILRLTVGGDYQQYSRLYLECCGLYNLTAEDWQTICDLLGVKNTRK